MNKFKTYMLGGLAMLGSFAINAQDQKPQKTDGQTYNSVFDVNSKKYERAVNENNDDRSVPINEVVGIVLRSRGIQNATEQDSMKVRKEIFDNFVRNSKIEPRELSSMNIVDGENGKKVLTYNTKLSFVKEISVNDMRDMKNADDTYVFSEGELAAAMGLIEPNKKEDQDCDNCDNTLEDKVKDKKEKVRSKNGLGIGGGYFSPMGAENELESLSEGYYATLVLPMGNWNVDFTYFNNVGFKSDELTRNVLDEYLSNSGRLFQDVEYVGNNSSLEVVAGLGLSRVFNFKEGRALELGVKALGGTSSESPFNLRREEVFFDGEYVGQGTTPEQIVTEKGKSKTGIVGGQVLLRYHLGNSGLALEGNASYLKNNEFAVGGGLIFYLGKNK